VCGGSTLASEACMPFTSPIRENSPPLSSTGSRSTNSPEEKNSSGFIYGLDQYSEKISSISKSLRLLAVETSRLSSNLDRFLESWDRSQALMRDSSPWLSGKRGQ